MEIKIRKIITAEIILIFATVLIFRSAWLLLDKIPLMNEAFFLWVSLILGTVIALLALGQIVKKRTKI